MRLFRKRQDNAATDDVHAQAARWLARMELGLMQRDEEAQLNRWRENPQNDAALTALRAMLDETREAASEPGIAKMRSEALAQSRRGPLLLGNVPVSAAAVVVMGVLLVFLLWPKNEPHPFAPLSPSAIGSASDPIGAYQTSIGERRVINLADGSVLTLNTQSRAEVLLESNRRTVRLVRGQALFDVAHDKQRPFTVIAGQMEVTALGTRFDVRVDDGKAKVVLVQGRIVVKPLELQGISKLIPALERHYLEAGEQLTANAVERKMSVGVADIEQSTSWQHGWLVFRGEALSAAVAEFNRYGQRQLTIADASLAQLPVSGVFAVSKPDNFLAAVSAFYPVKVEARSPNLTVLSLQEK